MTATPYVIETSLDMLTVLYSRDLSAYDMGAAWREAIEAIYPGFVIYDLEIETPLDPEHPFMFMAYPLYGDMQAKELERLTALIQRVYAEEAQP